MNTERSRRSSLVALGAAWLVAAVLWHAPARAQVYYDVFSSQGNLAAEGAANWWEAHGDEFRSVSNCCLPWVQEAYARQQQALAYYEAARNTTGDESRELNRLGNEQINIRTELLLQFRDCVNDANHARNVAQQGGDATGLMPAGCGEPLSDIFEMDDGLGVETARDWYLYEISAAVRDRASCCADLIEDAERAHDRALRRLGESTAGGLTRAEREALVEKARKSFRARTRLLTRFHKCVKQAARSLGTPLPPARLAVAVAAATEQASDGESGPNTCRRFELGVEKFGAEVEADENGDSPVEPGVDWDAWYKKWIELVRLEVYATTERHFAKDSNTYECFIDYTVFPDRRVVINGGNCSGSLGKGLNFGNTLRARLLELNYGKLPDGRLINDPSKSRVPAFPAGTKRTQVRRFFTFKHNLGPKGIKLGGPPNG